MTQRLLTVHQLRVICLPSLEWLQLTFGPITNDCRVLQCEPNLLNPVIIDISDQILLCCESLSCTL